ncbi:hypothetical protein [Candidatus Magnetaquicoccus inordinatus]|uniref:hypothetical protein n=1 Tax=Candidatus Magnetaquicoccus inordinatus TaxID=2496818 RepID=UPI00102B0724|nr:hypothetical protein [Candidatus Magnetaquicoccus inordinatus]
MSQSDLNIGNQSGAGYRAAVNTALQALVSQSSGDTEPATTYPHQLWADTTTGLIKQRTAGNDGWFVAGNLSGSVFATKTSNYTATISDYDGIFLCNGTFTFSLSAAASLGDGWSCTIKNTGTGTITIDPSGSETIDGSATLSLSAQYQQATIVCDGGAFYVVSGLIAKSIGTAHLKNGTAGYLLGFDGSGVAAVVPTPTSHETSGPGYSTTSGTSVELTGIPTTATRVTVSFDRVSLSGTDNLVLQIGGAQGYMSANYYGSVMSGASQVNENNGGIGARLTYSSAAATLWCGQVMLAKILDNVWSISGILSCPANSSLSQFAYSKEITGGNYLTKVRIVPTGTNTFDSGGINYSYI